MAPVFLRSTLDSKKLTQLVAGLSVSHLLRTEAGAVALHFTDGSALVVAPDAEGVVATFHVPEAAAAGGDAAERPTPRQREYLDFIQKYVARFGVSPAESDIQQHFLVSAPSSHQMIKTLERRGFITRQRNFFGQVVPRSIRIVDPV